LATVIESVGCAACGAEGGLRTALRLGEARLDSCPACRSWTYLPRPTPDEQQRIHDNPEYFEHPYFEGRRALTPAMRRRCRQTFERVGAAVALGALRGRRVLDVGCDTGAFLRAAAEAYGIEPVGIDVNARAVAVARGCGVEAYHTDLESLDPELDNFEVITAIDLIEHVPDPARFLRQLGGRLAPGGVAYLETPHIRSLVYGVGRLLGALTGGRPRGLIDRLFPPQHVQYFTAEGFAFLAARAGLEVVHLGRRALPFSDLMTSLPVRVGLSGLQLLDRLAGREILLCALLRRPT
jgi:SAM-dependent methyltransferase